ncbi:MAG: HD domain-containing protein [Acidimicrobiales bacterium]
MSVMSEQSRRWASTMSGHPSGEPGIRTAHNPPVSVGGSYLGGPSFESPSGTGPPGVLDRGAREAEEEWLLEPGATRSLGAGSRAVEEVADPWRTCFERDRDRIMHSAAFRRLAGKTQVFIFPADHQRTRLTHALEVTQVAAAISRACRLNVALTEAIALGHDCGHGPGGHASEEALSPFLPEGFDHAVWGADVTAASLNLCAETLDGIRNHSWSRPSPATPEGEVVALADRIAYCAHDLEDAVHAGIVTNGELPPLVAERCGTTRGRQLNAFVTDAVMTTLSSRKVAISEAMGEALEVLRRFNYERIYLRPASIEQSAAVVELLRSLVDHYVSHPAAIPGTTGLVPGHPDTVRAAVGYVSGMTDRFACTKAVELFGVRATVLVDAMKPL